MALQRSQVPSSGTGFLFDCGDDDFAVVSEAIKRTSLVKLLSTKYLLCVLYKSVDT